MLYLTVFYISGCVLLPTQQHTISQKLFNPYLEQGVGKWRSGGEVKI